MRECGLAVSGRIRPNRISSDSEMPITSCPYGMPWNAGFGRRDSMLAQQHRRQYLKRISHKKKIAMVKQKQHNETTFKPNKIKVFNENSSSEDIIIKKSTETDHKSIEYGL